MVLYRRTHPTQLQITVASSTVTSHLLGVTVTSNLSWSCTHKQHMWQGEETVGPALLPFPDCWQEGSVQTIQIYCSAPARILCLCVGPTVQRFAAKLATSLWSSAYQDPIQLTNWTPLATCRKRQKLLLCRCNLLGGATTPSSIFTPQSPFFSKAPSCTVWHYTILTQELQSTYTHSALAL